jgi:hypothetical protein
MASGDDGNPLPVIFGAALLICCGTPIYTWWRIGHDNEAKAEMKPVVASFLDAWRAGDADATGRLSCDGRRDEILAYVRDRKLVGYDALEMREKSNKYGTSFYAEVDLTFADSRENAAHLYMEDEDGGWRVCSTG